MNFLTVFQQGDTILISVFVILILMSVSTWYMIITRGIQALRIRHANKQVENELWNANNWHDAESKLQHSSAPYANLVRQGLSSLRHYRINAERPLGQSCDLNEFLTRSIRKELSQETNKNETGMTLLASVGSTAPFVGLFGTVWGIYHALVNIGIQGQVSIATVAGPIGEALVATAAGLAAAIPAVLAYNALNRVQRVIAQEMDYFAHDLHAQLLTHPGDENGIR